MTNEVTSTVPAAIDPARIEAAKQHAAIALTSAAELKALQAAMGQKQADALTLYAGIWLQQSGTMTDKEFDRDVKPTMVEAFKASGTYATPATIGNAVNNHKVAIIGLHGGYEPLKGETLQVYAKRVRPLIIADGLYEPRGGGRPASEGKGEGDGEETATDSKGNKVALTRELALNLLCKGNLADMEVLGVMIDKHMPAIRAMFASLYPVAKAA